MPARISATNARVRRACSLRSLGGIGLNVGVQEGPGMAKTVMIVEDNELNMKLFRDLFLMDIQLPEVSGLEVTKWLKEDEELRTIPVVAVTAFAMKGDEERILEGGCEAYLSKPISVAKFLETVRTYLGDR